ncbi:hypothetical protein A3C98_01550 [Candidatus Roizmanbacteria bacterium RIFCSPHIGHO2_02_FULL_37_15]|uniref:UDP-N-acetyl-alpha-D-muramoyl-L-alanyl-L-glutamate epimerase n=1 Tax=Candidatus Roizmanbacteria bacterium RIFCSPLOWO2_01_FULL_37_16 TaxID=1802058 RepID=A0A1F7IQJ3_9BACT|nr:MAG: hypothetical protein A2859_00455 [Candidatus Roizmanbacteria bacterium RIFCSPHIGHO2_01_FULL_37_16b]OGK21158.1 MAG: hypothetical protein A3C98_01550 [Candidatus Roizmanbacteria bacterium RIFCSPHIGHO2_02_FULL_37_15]OGK32734.1 MAG: hypothetical protein A3F57_02045 [Candidatus Roizmanbacteria bacterium RIFCSPHIGHO2_12_FULL_36_11]OGK45636.1 MAG: hypothetical protein A3B40_00390 [Candidatus Roizmanbacteria bacterium RIFCSPLOWO2_01_FULL_37_16]
MNKSTIHIFRKIKRTGIEIKTKNKKYSLNYPFYIWNKFPKSLHRLFADNATYVATWHLPLVEKSKIIYHFSHPPIETIFFKMLLYTIPMNIFEARTLKTSELIKNFYNANFQTQYRGLNFQSSGKKVKKQLKEKAIVLFSFGKDSLLTYGLLKEVGVTTCLVFMREPQSPFENAHKRKLADRFYNKFNEEVIFFPLSIGRLRQTVGLYWGWDIILSQYAFVLIPYYFYYQTRYLFFGNEQSCNFFLADKEGYLVNPVFEQSVSAMQLLQDIPQLFSIQTHIGSLVEPINEIFITYILHHRYPDIGKFQMSCFSEEEPARKKRWCGVCEKCARMYIFLKALNISPERVGFYNSDMLSFKKEKYYVLFNGESDNSAYGGSGLGRDEQLLAFYLAYKNGVKDELINKFKSLHLEEAEKKKEKLIKEYFGILSSYSLPSTLRKKTLRIFEKEQIEAKKYLKKIL